MSLRADRVIFGWGLRKLMDEAERLGFMVAVDFVKRCPECKVGKLGPSSLHYEGRAVDLLLYADLDMDGDKDDYVTDTERHRPLGEFWESLHPRFRWGGRYNDGNHYEILPVA